MLAGLAYVSPDLRFRSAMSSAPPATAHPSIKEAAFGCLHTGGGGQQTWQKHTRSAKIDWTGLDLDGIGLDLHLDFDWIGFGFGLDWTWIGLDMDLHLVWIGLDSTRGFRHARDICTLNARLKQPQQHSTLIAVVVTNISPPASSPWPLAWPRRGPRRKP